MNTTVTPIIKHWISKVPRLISFALYYGWKWRAHLIFPSCSPKEADWAIQTGGVATTRSFSHPLTISQSTGQHMDESHGSAASPRPWSTLSSSKPSTSYGTIMANTISAQTTSPPVKPTKGWTAFLWSVSHLGSVPPPETLTPSVGTRGINPQKSVRF